ncbi:hypothetical protein IAI53_11875 [Thauera sp. CAU 1555]|uniref:Dinitrogenase iron-molybdenum cofactor biosynthesis domain-containing protein n=1 Tax=Thauera sedimentorum TaxID=2767595 RepID=A0ABR9BB54_9RHOO|nr:hypothetical protein [Thauera sedimentorum]MBC9072664.1 hypothetical protein [Thauera sedimentorum]MBD8503583.1 hypothetical protein [Thauera sedimentorum]
MKIAVATREFAHIAGHAGKAAEWLVFDWDAGRPLTEPQRVRLERAQLFHYFDDAGPHPLDGVALVIAGSAGDGFRRHMAKRGAEVLLTGESEPRAAVDKLIAGEELDGVRFDPLRLVCGVRDLFARH